MIRHLRYWVFVVLAAPVFLSLGGTQGDDTPAKGAGKPYPEKAGDYPNERAKYDDSFKYYGPNGLWKSWTPAQREGRDTWIFWTGGNQKFLRLATHLGGSLQLPISIEFYRML